LSRPQKSYNQEEAAALLRGARGHWCGGIARWIIHTGCTRAEACRLRWSDVAWVTKSHPLHAELWERRRRAAEIATATGAQLDGMRVYPNYYGLPMNPTTLCDRLHEMLLRGRALNGNGGGAEHGRAIHQGQHTGRG
jgi:integrase